jgi:PAS domain S-box-containing protein
MTAPTMDESEELLRLLVDGVKDFALFMLDLEGRVITWNPGAERIKGYRSVEILGRPMSTFYPDEDRAAGLPGQHLETAAREGRCESEGWRVRKDGTRFWASAVLTALHDHTGRLRGYAKLTRDFTERRRAEETARRLESETAAREAAQAAEARLRESEERYRVQREQLAIILANVADGVTAHDAAGKVYYANDAAARACGYPDGASLERASPGEVLARFEIFDEHGHPVDPGALPGRRALLGEPAPEMLLRVRDRTSGAEWWSSVRAQAVRDQAGQPWLAVNIWRDVTERRRSELVSTYLAEAADVLAAGLDYGTTLERIARLTVPRLADWCVVHVLEGGTLEPVTVMHSDAEKAKVAREMLRRYPTDPAAPGGVGRVLLSGASELYPEISDEMLAKGARDAAHLAALRAIGIRSAIVVPLAGRGRALGVLTLVTAESGRRFGPADVAVVEELGRRAGMAIDNARLYREATDAVRVRDDFLSVAGHELKTPLAALLLQVGGLVRLLRRDPAQDPVKLIERLEKAAASGTRLEKLIDELLDISRITSGRLRLEPEELDLAEVVRELAFRFGDECVRAGCRLEVEADEPVRGRWDRVRIEQVINNLLSNALKYGAGKPVLISAARVQDRAVLTVADRGIGIDPAHQSRIFERFERAVSERHYGGLGLGLWIARQIIEAHGGNISVHSVRGDGATFVVELPCPSSPPAG